MAQDSARKRQVARPGAAAEFLAILLVFLPSAAMAQDPSTGATFTRQTRFWIPFEPEGAVHRLRQVELYFSRDQGRHWQHVQTAAPNQRGFQFLAERDGTYWFTVRTVDIDNRAHPPTIDGATPGLVVAVDTQPPAVRLTPLTPQDGWGVEWDIRDENLDLRSFRMEWRAPGGSIWQPLQVEPSPMGRQTWPRTTASIDEVRLQVRDKAGNVGEAQMSLSGRRSDNRASPAESASAGGSRPLVRLVNSQRIHIDYEVKDIGASGATLELWWTRDGGRTWEKCLEPKQPPCLVSAPQEGLYGFTLVARSGVNLGDPPPQPGDPPQIWVEVDLKPPEVRLESVEVGRGADANRMTIRWTSSDKNLDEKPVKLQYTADKNGTWLDIVSGQPAQGHFSWIVPSDGVRYYVRAISTDRAGNTGHAETPKPVVVDLSRPRGIIKDAAPVRGDAPGSSSDPPSPLSVPGSRPNNPERG